MSHYLHHLRQFLRHMPAHMPTLWQARWHAEPEQLARRSDQGWHTIEAAFAPHCGEESSALAKIAKKQNRDVMESGKKLERSSWKPHGNRQVG